MRVYGYHRVIINMFNGEKQTEQCLFGRPYCHDENGLSYEAALALINQWNSQVNVTASGFVYVYYI